MRERKSRTHCLQMSARCVFTPRTWGTHQVGAPGGGAGAGGGSQEVEAEKGKKEVAVR